MEAVRLKAKRDYSVRGHHPWIFSGALAEEPANLMPGATVEVLSASGETLGYGAYSPQSQIRVRMWSWDKSVSVDQSFIEALVVAALRRRVGFHAGVEARRLVNAESDGLPGLVVDDYAGRVVCQFSSAGAEFWKPVIVETLMKSVPGILSVSERRDLKDREKEGLATEPAFETLSGGEPPEIIEIEEAAAASGPILRFGVDIRHGHKTGFYLDQREARRTVAAFARDREVLNCFAYTGGFGLYAAAAGAKKVTQVDISAEALRLARMNAELNPGLKSEIEYVEADVFEYLRKCRDMGRRFDLIVLDPPKFAATKSQLMKAARGYKDINLLAMKLLRPRGVLATFSCSGAMTPAIFDQVLAEAAHDAGRDFQLLVRTGPGLDHPVALSFPEGEYLKGVILQSMQ